ncbi:ABC transporter substrate-binding protein [Falsirhodobacter halotolerans]|uniref:ABC transporter substrate-binding protein n=1 Tax=Falsirhodobacter halotolerans TaxID=1146892 RepID=UPI001FD4471E|nr:ABC transporter substrate-binding protein [Falsirhodobacter halotolerans]MCJ8139094.1 ABC transporter substrate-binding protein [Falsirhodobacter halotolerans]
MISRVLTLNQGDPSEARLYYLPHLVAEAAGFFAEEGLEIRLLTAAEGGDTIAGGQIPSVLSGMADLTIGGPMVTMKMAEEGTRLVNFCAAVRSNPWFILGEKPEPDFDLTKLAGQVVVDVAQVGTAGFIFDAVMAERGIAAIRIGGAFPHGGHRYAIHHLHATANAIAERRIAPLADLAGPTGGVPWSAYIARPDTIAAMPEKFAAFRRAIGAALTLISMAEPAEIAAMIASSFPDHGIDALTMAIALYRDADLWPATTAIPREDFDRFGALLMRAGWLTRMPSWADLTETSDA